MIATAPALTDRGKSLLMRAIAGEAITFTRFKVGSGTLPAGTTGDSLNDLITPTLAFSITDMDDTQEGLITLTGEFDNENVTEDFPWREMGIFAHGEDNEEILYAYANDGANASVVRRLNTDVLTIQTITMIIAVGEAQNVTAVYSPHRQYASSSDLTDHTSNHSNPHAVTKSQVGLGNVKNLAPDDMYVNFSATSSEQNIASGMPFSILFARVKNILAKVLSHMSSTTNPHSVTLAQVGAAASSHTHKPADIVRTGTQTPLAVNEGGTGVTSMQDLRDAIGTNAAIGIYTGDGTVKRGLNLGFVPSAVILFDEWGNTFDAVKGVRGGLAVGAYGIRTKASQSATNATVWDDAYTALLVGEDSENNFAGFWVSYVAGNDADESISTNESGVTYHYIAYR